MMDIRAIHTEADYEWAIKEIERYFDEQPEPGTPEGDRFEVLATLVEAYEGERFPIPEADPVDVLHYAIAAMGRSRKELEALLGRSRAWEVLNRRRPLTLEMIRKISEAWHIPAGALTSAYKLAREHA
jgi:HTH-type transcriptional regulator/antitoxin HigA